MSSSKKMNKGRKGGRGPKQSGRGMNRFSERQRMVESEDMRSDPVDVESRGSKYNAHSTRPNDPRWYAQNAQLMQDYASFPFADPVGTSYPSTIPGGMGQNSVPGLFTLNFLPSVGWADSEVSPVNVAMRRLYSFVRHANSGASNYDAPDLMLYVIAVDSAHMYLAWMKRLYGVMLDYTPYNRYYPRALIHANNVSFDDLEKHLNDFRGYINQFAVKLSQLWIPNSMSYMARHQWMCEGIYVDSDSAKAQTYMYVPTGYYKFTLTDGVGSLIIASPSKSGSGGRSTFSDIINFGDSLLNPMISNEDFGIMGGDILKAFGESGILKPEMISEGYQILPVYSQEVLSQIENSVALGGIQGLNITQTTAVGTGYLVSTPTAVQTTSVADGISLPQAYATQIAQYYSAPRMLNMHHGPVAPSEVMVATRLMAIPNATAQIVEGPALQVSSQLKTCGSEIVTSFNMFFYFTDVSTGAVTLSQSVFNTHLYIDLYSEGNKRGIHAPISELLPMLSQFDWHPLMDVLLLDCSDGKTFSLTLPRQMIGDVDYYTFIDSRNLSNMNLTALLSELTIPQIG